MVYYACPNCGHRSDEYSDSMVHYNACTVVRERPGFKNTPDGRAATDPGPSQAGPGIGQSPPKTADPALAQAGGAKSN
ncbi:hypothetical protein BMF94_2314 [Rhodotorula taiwanensis]|uniref:Uncharacterized protein n=1 Tax=Rhodotorula taiwanensis TaxID=741276 RepID=A0A2S5BCR9_9BASI|nr:hypothetical protein BMF94_2314 [Rhodotorula taiwanensis]